MASSPQSWAVHQARQNFSKLLDQAEQHGPQVITDHGLERSVVLSIGEYRTLKADKPNMIEFLLGPGPVMEDLEGGERRVEPWREIDFG